MMTEENAIDEILNIINNRHRLTGNIDRTETLQRELSDVLNGFTKQFAPEHLQPTESKDLQLLSCQFKILELEKVIKHQSENQIKLQLTIDGNKNLSVPELFEMLDNENWNQQQKIKELEAKQIIFPTDDEIEKNCPYHVYEQIFSFKKGANWAKEFIKQKNGLT